MIIYIRHGKDEEEGYAHDGSLTEKGKEEVLKFTKRMVEEHGYPDVIYYSPFYRARQTVKQMLKVLNTNEKKIKTKIHPFLGRFFSSYERMHPEVHKKTLEKGAIIQHDKKQFKRRVEKHLKYVKHKIEDGEYKVIWNVSHALVLVNIIKFLNIERDLHIEYLDTIILKENEKKKDEE